MLWVRIIPSKKSLRYKYKTWFSLKVAWEDLFWHVSNKMVAHIGGCQSDGDKKGCVVVRCLGLFGLRSSYT
jgi:hypothetical protein